MTTPEPRGAQAHRARPARPAEGKGSGPSDPPVDWDAEEEGHDTWRGRARGTQAGGRTWWVVGVVAVLVMTATAIWFGVAASHGKVQWINTGHEVVSDTTVQVRFDLRRDPTRAVTCQVEAQDFSHAVVGRTEVTVGPTEESPSRHIEPVESAARAVTGYVQRCWYADEAPPENR